MGACYIAGHCNDGFTPEDCRGAAGSYSSSSCADGGSDNPDKGKKKCLMAAAFPLAAGQAILTIGLTYQHQVDFREKVLRKSSMGKKMVKLYYAHKNTLISVSTGDIVLLAEMFMTWIRILNFVRTTVAVASGEGSAVPTEHRRLRFTEDQHARVVKVMERMRSNSTDKKFHSALDEVQKELKPYVGLSPAEAIALIQGKKSKRSN